MFISFPPLKHIETPSASCEKCHPYPKPGGSKCHIIAQLKPPSSVCWYSALGWETLRSTFFCLKVIQKGLMVMAIWQRMALLWDSVEPGENGDWLIDTENCRAMLSREQDDFFLSGFRGTHVFPRGISVAWVCLIKFTHHQNKLRERLLLPEVMCRACSGRRWSPPVGSKKASVRVGIAEWKFRNCWFHTTATPRN